MVLLFKAKTVSLCVPGWQNDNRSVTINISVKSIYFIGPGSPMQRYENNEINLNHIRKFQSLMLKQQSDRGVCKHCKLSNTNSNINVCIVDSTYRLNSRITK